MMKKYQIVLRKKASPTVEIFLPDGRIFSGPRGTTLEEFFSQLPEWQDSTIIAGIANSELHELTYPIRMESNVQPISIEDTDGARIYRRSLTFLLEAAFETLFPTGITLSVDHSVASGGFFCEVEGRPPLNSEEIHLLERKMRDLVAANLPFLRKEVPLTEAISYFEQKGSLDKVRLLKYRQKKYMILYHLGDYRDYHHGYMVPSSGYLKYFGLAPLGNGFVLRFPRRHHSRKLLPLPETPRLLETFHQYGEWLEKLGIDSVGALNDSIRQERIREIILMSEALHEQKIAEIASKIASCCEERRVILIAGPSSSGKTTFSKRLAVQLLARGIEPFAMELDNYFVDRIRTPKDAKGDYDYEVLEALDTKLLSKHVALLIKGEEVTLRKYDFKTGEGDIGDTVRLKKEQLIILEGIHGLNPKLLPEISNDLTFRIYVSCLTQLNLDKHNRISTTDTRLIRRIVRDARERGYSAQQTIQRWESVRRGEKAHIYPYQEFADEMFNSALVYELSGLKPLIEPLLRQVIYGVPEFIEAKRLLAFLEWFLPLSGTDMIPDNSILREFIGGSILQDFKLWKNS
jgi:uridine kinase